MKFLLSIILVLSFTGSVFAGGYAINNKGAVVVQQKVVQFDQRYFQGLDGYYTAIDELRSERQTEDIDELKAINQTLRAQIELLIKLCGNKEVPPTTPAVPTEPPVTPNPLPEPPASGDGEPTALDEEVYNIFTSKCSSCHNEKDKKGGLALINKSNGAMIWQPLENRTNIHEHVRRVGLAAKGLSPMPPGAPLPDKDVEVLYQWMQEEAKNLREKQ